jgi:3-oxoacyl-[acyl-carrier protein] reductase
MNIFTGKKFVLKRKITQKDIKVFSNLSGDKNPIHLNQDYSKKMGFGKIVVHGMLSETFISAIIGNNLPGPGSLWAEKNIKFLKIVREGDIIILKSEIKEIHESNNLAIVEIKAFNQFKELIFDSINKIILPKNAKVKKIRNIKKKLITKKIKEKKINVKKNLAIIIGASGGIGIEVTKKLLKKNFNVIAFYNSSFKDLKKLKINNKNLSYFNLNLKNKKSLEKCLNIIKKNHPTHFINCFSPKIYPINFEKITDQDFDHYFDKSLINIFLIIKGCVKRFKLIGRGNIIDISSIYLKLPELNFLPYITFKGSMSAMIKSLSAELASFNIRANSVTAGVTDTQQISEMSYKQKLLLAAKTPLQRIAKPIDIANVVYFLSSNDSEFITGSSIDVNGGII